MRGGGKEGGREGGREGRKEGGDSQWRDGWRSGVGCDLDEGGERRAVCRIAVTLGRERGRNGSIMNSLTTNSFFE